MEKVFKGAGTDAVLVLCCYASQVKIFVSRPGKIGTFGAGCDTVLCLCR